MSRSLDWRQYVNDEGDFELPAYLYRCISDLMKAALDMGTLLSTDQARLRAFKEQTKSVFKNRWLEVAQALEAFDIIVPCGCPQNEYCRSCGGARYRLNSALSPSELREISYVVGSKDRDQSEVQTQLEIGLRKALHELEAMRTAPGKELDI